MKTHEYTVVLHQAEEGGFWVEVPALEGCYTQGETVEKALVNAKAAIALYLKALRGHGKPIPKDVPHLLAKVVVVIK